MLFAVAAAEGANCDFVHGSGQVVDEADRLLRQAYQDWLPFAVAAAGADGLQQGASSEGSGSRVLKFVASATLTRDPAKIDRLGLHCPRYLALEAADKR